MHQDFSLKEIEQYYEFTGEMFSLAWGDNWHFGYWPEDQPRLSFAEAQEYLTRYLLKKLPVKKGDRILDVGCGVGLPAIHIARETGARVTGINISDYQLNKARELVKQAAMEEQIEIRYGNGMDLDFEDAGFDCVWAMESLCHMNESARALGEINRVLKKGGYFAFTDIFEIIPMRPEHIDSMNYVFRLATIHSLDAYKQLLEKSGFSILTWENISRNTSRTSLMLAGAMEQSAPMIKQKYGDEYDQVLHTKWPKLVGAFKRCGYLLGVVQKK